MKKSILLIIPILLIYIISRLTALTALPVFADEAIYIRWAQITAYEPEKYAFLPLYDGKTPLFIWMLAPWLRFVPVDPLWLGRFASGLIGLLCMYVLSAITYHFSRSKMAAATSAGLFIVLPFTLFYSRMALIDMLLTALLGLSFLFFLRFRARPGRMKNALISGIFWGMAVITKTSAIFFLPVIFGVLGIDLARRRLDIKRAAWVGAAFGAGLIPLMLMMFSSMFPFLFQRSADFTHSAADLIANPWHILATNVGRIFRWLTIYLTPPAVLSLGLIPIVFNRRLKRFGPVGLLIVCLLLFLFPYVVTGKLLASRYFLPAVIFIIPAIALALNQYYQKMKWLWLTLTALILVFSTRFGLPLLTAPNKTPFAHEDVVQYLTEWSSGHGIPEVRDFLRKKVGNTQITVATEGYFGTLPDGLFIYFDHSDYLNNLEIFGIGQPVVDIPDQLYEKAKSREVYLVVNSHRFEMKNLPKNVAVVAVYPRPYSGPSLQLYRILPK